MMNKWTPLPVKIILIGFVVFFLLIPLSAVAHEDTETHIQEFVDAGFTQDEAALIVEHFEELEGGHGSGGFWPETWDLLTDPAHWVIEAAAEVAFLAFNLIVFDRLIHRHRQGKHDLDGDL